MTWGYFFYQLNYINYIDVSKRWLGGIAEEEGRTKIKDFCAIWETYKVQERELYKEFIKKGGKLNGREDLPGQWNEVFAVYWY